MSSFLGLPFFSLSLMKPSLFFCASMALTDSVLFFLCMFFLVYVIISFTKFNYLQKSEKISYLLMFSLVFASLSLCFSSSSPLIFLFWLEMCVFLMIYLIFNFSKEVDKVPSTLFMFFFNIFGSIPFMSFCHIFGAKLQNMHWSTLCLCSSLSMSVLFSMVLILIFKLPVFIGHFWLTKAHVSASGPLSMILASLMLKLGSMGMLKFNYVTFFSFSKILSSVASLCLVACLVFTILMIFFFDLKFLVACSSILHMSMIVPMSLSSSNLGCASAVFMTVGHGFTSLILFFLLTLIYEFSMSRSADLSKCQESQSKFYAKWIFLFSFINLGVPPFLSFMSELLLFSFLVGKSMFASWIFGFVMLGSLFFTILLILKVLFGKKNDSTEMVEVAYFSPYLKFCSFILLLIPILIF